MGYAARMELHPVVEAFLPVISGTLVLGAFGGAMLGLVQHRRAEGTLVRGLRVGSRPLSPAEIAALRALPERCGGDWGWARREGEVVAVFADPYSTADGMRVSTPWPYRAVVDLSVEAPMLTYRAPTALLIGLGLLLLPIAPALFLINHGLQVPKIDARLARLTHDQG